MCNISMIKALISKTPVLTLNFWHGLWSTWSFEYFEVIPYYMNDGEPHNWYKRQKKVHENKITRTDMKRSYAKTPCLLDTKLSEQSELLKTLRCEAYAEFTQSENKKKHENSTLESKSTTVSLCCDHIPRVEHIYPHTCEFDLIFSLRRSVGLAPHMEIKGTENKGPADRASLKSK